MTNDITPLTLGWTIVYVEDPVAASAFYADTFGLTPDFDAVMLKALALSPGERYQTAGEFQEALTRCA